MFVYTDALATPGNLTTNGTANTETEAFFLKPGASRSLYLAALAFGGKSSGASTLTALSMRIKRLTTASTSGTALSIVPRDPSAPATTITGASAPTSGSGAVNAGPILTCGATGPNQWMALNPDHMPSLPASSTGCLSGYSSSGGISMPYEFSAEHQEW